MSPAIYNDDERSRQVQEGRVMASRERQVLHLPRRDTDRRPPAPAPVSKPAKGHEAFLKALVATGAMVSVKFVSDGSCVSGKLKHADKYTLTVQDDVSGHEMVIFKHAIEAFWSLTPKAERADV